MTTGANNHHVMSNCCGGNPLRTVIALYAKHRITSGAYASRTHTQAQAKGKVYVPPLTCA